MKKIWVILLILAILLIGVIFGIYMYSGGIWKISRDVNETKLDKLSEKVTDECTDEMNELNNQITEELEANYSEEKISPNCFVILKRYYTECGHTVKEYTYIPERLVNKMQDEIEEEYQNWTVEQFSSTEIILQREFNSNCGQHFLVKENDGKIAVFKINDNNEELLYEQTEISIEYLTETDKNEIRNGIRVNGKEELNQLIEDFE